MRRIIILDSDDIKQIEEGNIVYSTFNDGVKIEIMHASRGTIEEEKTK